MGQKPGEGSFTRVSRAGTLFGLARIYLEVQTRLTS
jgi:hypothetical protein